MDFRLVPPVLMSPTAHAVTATTLSLNWTQSGSPVDSYTVSYTYTIRRCGSGPISDSVVGISSNARSTMLDNLEEDSVYSITLTANNGTAEVGSNIVMATTDTAGIYVVNITLDCKLFHHIPQLPLAVHQVSMSLSTEP